MLDKDAEVLDKVIRTWKHILSKEKLSPGLRDCITETVSYLEELKKRRE